jgi:hypothetical protein
MSFKYIIPKASSSEERTLPFMKCCPIELGCPTQEPAKKFDIREGAKSAVSEAQILPVQSRAAPDCLRVVGTAISAVTRRPGSECMRMGRSRLPNDF